MPYYHFLQDVAIVWVVIVFILAFFAAGYTGAPLLVHTLLWSALLYGLGAPVWLWILLGVFALIFHVPALRRALVSGPVMQVFRFVGFSARDFRNRTDGH